MLKAKEIPVQNEKALLHCPKCNEEFPAQGRERYVHIVDVVRENQNRVLDLLTALNIDPKHRAKVGKWILRGMEKMDRDAILQPGGILTDEQIELLK